MRAVMASQLLDTLPEESFDFFTRMASRLVATPFAFATIVDENRSFWKSSFGLPPGSPRQNTVEESFCRYVIQTGRELVVNDARVDEITKNNVSIQSMGVLAWAGFPIRAPDDEILGTFCVVDTQPRTWTEYEINIIEAFALAISREIALRFALTQAKLEKDQARILIATLQDSLLPPSLPEIPELDVAACFLPAGSGTELVGDFYDVFQTSENAWSFLMGDVCGKGLEAAKLATFARHAVSSSAANGSGVGRVLERLNRTLLARKHEYDRYLTAVYGNICKLDGAYTLQVACAGHVPPLIKTATGSTEFIKAHGSIIGIFDDFQIEQDKRRLAPGDTIVMYTDGVTEARCGKDFFGEERLVEALTNAPADISAQALASLIQNSVRAFSRNEISDDVAIMVIKIPL